MKRPLEITRQLRLPAEIKFPPSTGLLAVSRSLVVCVLMASLFSPLPSAARAGEFAFWVWHRNAPLSPMEYSVLEKASTSLFWHVGELDAGDAKLNWRFRNKLPQAGAIPVIRLNLNGTDPFKCPALTDNLVAMADPDGRLQIDCDCPDRLLKYYARFLGELRKRVPHLSATALAGWSRSEAFPHLQDSVEELAVMFYDLQPDALQSGPESPPAALLVPRKLAAELESWSSCKTPWRAGLPNFTRVTVFDTSGRSRGQIRNWSWDEIVFQPRLKFISSPESGLVLLRATGNVVLAATPVESGSLIAIRWVDAQRLRDALDAVKRSSAKGPIFFRLPDSTDPSGWSASQLVEWMNGEVLTPKLRLRKEGASFVLENDSPEDLPPRIAGSDERGYSLELDAPSRLWREALAGDFWRVASHADPEKSPVAVPIPLATRLTFWFGSLRAGKTLRSGLILLAPDADIREIHYRILPGDTAWKSIE